MENILKQKYKLPKSAAKGITAEAKMLLNMPEGATYSKTLEKKCIALAEDKGYLENGKPVEKLPQRTSWVPSSEQMPEYESKTLADCSDDQSCMTNFSKMTTASAPPGSSRFASSHGTSSRKKHHHGRRASTSFIPETGDPFASNDDTDWGFSSSSKPSKHTSSRRSSALGNSTSSGFGDEDPFASLAGRSVNSKPPKHHSTRRNSTGGREGDFASFGSTKPAPPCPAEINGVSEDFLFSSGSGSNHRSMDSRQKPQGEIAVPTLYEKGKTKNPLLMIPDPLSEHREQQHEQENFFAEIDKSKKHSKKDDPFADSDDDSLGGDFSDEGTINWDEGGVIVPKKEKYGSTSELGNSISFLNSSCGELITDRKKSKHQGTDRKRLSGLEKRNSRRNMDDELTTATPSTRFSTDSEYSASTTRSKKSNAPGVELKTGSLLSDLVLIMDGKMDIPGGNDEGGGEPRPSRRRSAGGKDDGGARPSRRRSNGGGANDDDPFVVRSEVRGAEMGAFVKGTRPERSRREPGRTKA
mmetsp:Transcript_3993/g.7972  ORF Transcript_3993/g.7972 Transcript_3993/m.7972 type:complete len:526 (+) Transcript_3993:116-1693(+)|eukprot:scaffold2510_cov169-Amphora_coffeaeformis.AAC.54